MSYPDGPPNSLNFGDACSVIRTDLKKAAELTKLLHRHSVFNPRIPVSETPAPDRAEMHVNIDLAYRHLEDARMRLGKAIQAFDGGKSAYDK